MVSLPLQLQERRFDQNQYWHFNRVNEALTTNLLITCNWKQKCCKRHKSQESCHTFPAQIVSTCRNCWIAFPGWNWNSKTVCLRISRRPYQLLCSKPKRVDSEMGDSRERRYCFHKCRLCKKLSCPLVARVKLRVSNCFLQAFLFVVVALQWLGRVPSGVSTPVWNVILDVFLIFGINWANQNCYGI